MSQAQPPAFQPKPGPVGRYLLFAIMPGRKVWGGLTAQLHDNDFDRLLVGIPDDNVGWHILDTYTGRINAGSDPDKDRTHPPIPPFGTNFVELDDATWLAAIKAGERWCGRYILFDKSHPGWGAWQAACHNTVGAFNVSGLGVHVLDMDTSGFVGFAGEGDTIIPSMGQVEAYRHELLEWQLENMPGGGAPDIDQMDAKSIQYMSGGVLPEGWENLPTDELRAIVEAAEADLAAAKAERGSKP